MSDSNHQIIISFRIQYQTFIGQQLFVIGNHPLLGNWNRQKALRMHYLKKSDGVFNWVATISFTGTKKLQTKIEYKYIILTSCYTPQGSPNQRDIRLDSNAEILWDAGPNRTLNIQNDLPFSIHITTADLFQPSNSIFQHIFFKTPFTDIIYSGSIDHSASIIKPNTSFSQNELVPILISSNELDVKAISPHFNVSMESLVRVRFRIIVLQLLPNQHVFVTGSGEIFQDWKQCYQLHSIDSLYSEFSIDLPHNIKPFDYKYLIKDIDGSIIWEERPNRTFSMPNIDSDIIICHDWLFQLPLKDFHGAGLLVALFSLHSNNSFGGLGEFLDLKILIDLAVNMNMFLIQLLPLQDTTLCYDFHESNPSRHVSAFAFSPAYLSFSNISEFNPITDILPDELELLSTESFKETSHFVQIAQLKHKILKRIFSRIDKNSLMNDNNFIDFCEANSSWLQDYCLWASIRDDCLDNSKPLIFPQYSSISIPQILPNKSSYPSKNPIKKEYQPWTVNDKSSTDEYGFIFGSSGCFQATKSSLNKKIIWDLTPQIEDGIIFTAWVQWNCHKQMLEVSQYSKEKRVILSCVMTIGQNRESADIWSHPNYFNTSYNIGSPPDIFSFHGQNWWYPSWNWESIKMDEYSWIKSQMFHLEQYFQSCQFDHPLGLFRTWSIPSNCSDPLLGHFVPSLPIDLKDLYDLQIRDVSKLCQPLFPILELLAFQLDETVRERLINTFGVYENGIWKYRSKFETDNQLRDTIKAMKKTINFKSLSDKLQFSSAKKILLSNFASVCLIPDPDHPHRKFYPRFLMTDSIIFKSLPERDAQVLYKLFADYYYRSNLELWHNQGHQKLSIMASSNMLFFGYDLGVLLHDEEKVLHQLGICSYRVQRIPKETTSRFDSTESYPYLSVCTPSPHDMPPLAIWWRNEQADVQQFFHQILKMNGTAPLEINEKIVEGILQMHFDSKSMWCVVLLDDLFALSSEFEKTDADKWLNDPSRNHIWDYRVKPSLEELLHNHKNWQKKVASLIESSNRGRNISSH